MVPEFQQIRLGESQFDERWHPSNQSIANIHGADFFTSRIYAHYLALLSKKNSVVSRPGQVANTRHVWTQFYTAYGMSMKLLNHRISSKVPLKKILYGIMDLFIIEVGSGFRFYVKLEVTSSNMCDRRRL